VAQRHPEDARERAAKDYAAGHLTKSASHLPEFCAVHSAQARCGLNEQTPF
jgi:hypothetical protein